MQLKFADKAGLSSLAVVDDWQVWWREWGPKIMAQHGRQGWILFMLEANDKVQEVSMVLARIIRNKPKWNSVGWSQKEWLNCAETAAEAQAWFEKHGESVMRDAPEWAKFILVAQHGNLTVLSRLARELRGIQENGHSTVVLEATANGIDLKEVA